MTLLIMAAGRGSRYGKLKQFDSLGPCAEFLMEYSIFDAIQSGFTQLVFITQKEQVSFVQDYFSARLPKAIKVQVIAQNTTDIPLSSATAVQREKPWGTAHAVWTARHYIDSPFAVINADDFYGRGAFEKAISFLKSNQYTQEHGLITYQLRHTLSTHGSVSRGVCSLEQGSLQTITERTKIALQNKNITDLESGVAYSGKEVISMNFWLLHPSFFKSTEQHLVRFLAQEENRLHKELYIPLVVQEMIANKAAKVAAIPSESSWFGITYAADSKDAIAQLQQLTQEQKYPSPLW